MFKKIAILLIPLLISPSLIFAQWGATKVTQEHNYPPQYNPCPTGIIDNNKCLGCHAVREGRFIVKETKSDEGVYYPNVKTRIRHDKGYYLETAVDADSFVDALHYYEQKGITHVVLEMFSPGGSVMEAHRIVGYIEEWKAKGNILETRIYGFAASAAFYILCSGSEGYRYASPTSEGMWHQAWILRTFQIVTANSADIQSDMMTHIQNTVNQYIADHTGMTKEEIDSSVDGEKMLWLNGVQMKEKKVVDHLIGK
jgi:ATP-dependent protease ClpP protease subunit